MIDWARVSELREEIGPDGFGEVITIFLEEADDTVTQLADAETSALADLLHFLKGSALNLGFRELARICQKGEGDVRLAERLTSDGTVMRVYLATRSELTEGLSKIMAA